MAKKLSYEQIKAVLQEMAEELSANEEVEFIGGRFHLTKEWVVSLDEFDEYRCATDSEYRDMRRQEDLY